MGALVVQLMRKLPREACWFLRSGDFRSAGDEYMSDHDGHNCCDVAKLFRILGDGRDLRICWNSRRATRTSGSSAASSACPSPPSRTI